MSDDDANTTPAEILARYQAGERLFDGAELAPGDSFRGALLAGAYFRNFWLHSTDFAGADLSGARFEHGNVKCVDFTGADMRNTVFRDVALCGSKFAQAKIEGSSVSDAGWYGHAVTDLAQLQS